MHLTCKIWETKLFTTLVGGKVMDLTQNTMKRLETTWDHRSLRKQKLKWTVLMLYNQLVMMLPDCLV